MREADAACAVAREWLMRAESDLKAAAFLMKMGSTCPTEVVCFHAQQCVEKYFKAPLVLEQRDFPKTHDLARLVALIGHRRAVDLSNAELAQLTDHAVAARYPGSGEVPLSEARRALALARRARSSIRVLLPLAVKRRSRR